MTSFQIVLANASDLRLL